MCEHLGVAVLSLASADILLSCLYCFCYPVTVARRDVECLVPAELHHVDPRHKPGQEDPQVTHACLPFGRADIPPTSVSIPVLFACL